MAFSIDSSVTWTYLVHSGFDTCMTKELLQDFRLHATFDCPCCVGVPECVHAESLNAALVTQLVKMRVIGAVLVRLSGSEIDKDQIPHDHTPFLPRPAVCIFQHL